MKYDKAVECLTKDRDVLLAFYDFPAEHWKHLRTTNVIESTFATVRHRTVSSKGCLSNKTALAMIFELAEAAERSWHRLRRLQPVAENHHGCKIRRRNRSCQIASSNRCRLIPSVTKIDDSSLGRVETIQFHQSYSYEDFVQGYRPDGKGGFTLRDGVFHRFCKKASRSPGRPHVFIIDEINRGNLTKIFGELMLLIEPDKRGPECATP